MKRQKYSLSNFHTTSMNMGELVPIGLTEVLPGDTFKGHTQALVRFGPMLAPVMHPVHVKIHHWFVPHRLTWEDWEDFITGGPDGMDASVFPTIDMSSQTRNVGDLCDYLGVNPAFSGPVSALPFRAYNLIFNEWYRDQDLVNERSTSFASGNDTTTLWAGNPAFVAWEKDYFTTARPWTQKGPDVTIPMATDAPVVSSGLQPTINGGGLTNTGLMVKGTIAGDPLAVTGGAATDTAAFWGNQTGMEADLSSVPGGINELRLAFALQRYEEARARYGSRYTEYLRYLGVKSSDARLQRPEYLGGGKQTVQFSEVLATAESESTVVGDLKGHGISSVRSNKFLRFFEEHGYLITCMSVMPISMYPDGINRTWWRRTKEDFFQKELQYIGQQEVLNGEVRASDPTVALQTFGYQDRYAEYRQGFSRVSGQFRTTLNYWQLARQFTTQPALNASFINANPSNRIFADQTADAEQIWVMVRNSIMARRIVGPGGKSFVL